MGLLCGDIIYLQRRLPETEACELNHPTVESFLKYQENRGPVNFRPLSSLKVRCSIESVDV